MNFEIKMTWKRDEVNNRSDSLNAKFETLIQRITGMRVTGTRIEGGGGEGIAMLH